MSLAPFAHCTKKAHQAKRIAPKHYPMKSYWLPVLLIFLLPITAFAQSQDTLRAELEEIRIEVNRGSSSLQQSPFATSLWQRTEAARLNTPGTSLEASLQSVPGLYINNRDNYSLGERLSIRGMGWRASFGVRGIQVLLDGIPLTSPDGQTILEIVDPNLIRSAEVIRGPNALFWGNGSGGTLYLRTGDPVDQPGVAIRSFAGSFGTHQTDIIANTNVNATNIQLSLSDFGSDGHREHSSVRVHRAGLKANHAFDQNNTLDYTGLFVVAPDIENPGSLTAEQASNNPKSANPMFITQNAGKEYTHIMQGLRFVRDMPNDRFEAVVHGTYRNLKNPIQPSIITIERGATGVRMSYQRHFEQFTALIVTDGAYQSDIRKNWVNDAGNRGNQTVYQREQVLTGGIAGILQYQIGRLGLSGGLRQDWIYFDVSDRLDGSDDASGNRLLQALTPQAGFTYELGSATIFGGISSAFESPTTTELVNRPDMDRGFNPDLNPETATGIEIGVRGYAPIASLRYDVALYQIDVRDRLISFQTESGGDRNFFENSGRNRHNGFESFVEWMPLPSLTVAGSYTYSNLKIISDENALKGNQIPGIPSHRGYAEVAFRHGFYEIRSNVSYHGAMYANNQNTVENDAYTLLGVIVSGEFNLGGGYMLRPFVQVRNLTNENYYSSVSINAFGGRFFEPGAPRNFLIGTSLSF